MGIKNMPEFDDIDIGQPSSSSTSKNKLGADFKGLLNTIGITEISQFKPILKMMGIDDATIEELLGSYDSLDDLVEELDTLDPSATGDLGDLTAKLNSLNSSLDELSDSLNGLRPKSQSQINNSVTDIFNLEETKDEAEADLDAYYNNRITTEEFVSEITDILEEYTTLEFTLDIPTIERDLDSIKNNPASSSNDIRNYIASHLYDYDTGDDEDEFLDEELDEDADDSDEEDDTEKESKHIKVFNDILEQLYNRKDEIFSIEYVPFTFSEFKKEFDITSDELEDEKIPSSKFSKCIPESWVESFDFITLATPFIEESSNKFIIGLPVPNFNKNDKIPAHFLIYKNSTGYHSYMIKEDNLVHDDGTLCSLSEIFTQEAIDKVTADSQNEDDSSSLQAMISSQLNGIKATVGQKSTNVNKILFKILMSSIGGYNDEVIFKRSENLMVKENSNPLMTLHLLGTLTPSLETKQYGNGFVYVGDIHLNDNEDVKYFLSDFELSPVNGKLEFYVRFGTSEIERNQLPKYKEFIRDRLDFNRDILQNHIEVQAVDNIVYIDF